MAKLENNDFTSFKIEYVVDGETKSFKDVGKKFAEMKIKIVPEKPKPKVDPFKFAVHLQEQFHEQDISGSEYEWMKLKPSEWYAYTLCGELPDDFLERWGSE